MKNKKMEDKIISILSAVVFVICLLGGLAVLFSEIPWWLKLVILK